MNNILKNFIKLYLKNIMLTWVFLKRLLYNLKVLYKKRTRQIKYFNCLIKT